jgi:hypothetical protein
MPRFGQEPDLANGLFLRTWRGLDRGTRSGSIVTFATGV